MNDIPRQKLKHIISQYDRPVCEDAKLCEGLLRDLCGQYRKEINVIVSAIKEGVVAELLNSQNNVSSDATLARLTKRLADRWGMSPDVAIWAVDSWALALGVISQPRSIEAVKENINQNLVPDSSIDRQSIVSPDPNIALASAPKPISQIFYIWTIVSTLAAIFLGGAYYFQSYRLKEYEEKISTLETSNTILKATIDKIKENIGTQHPVFNTYMNFCNQSSAEVISVAFSYSDDESIPRSKGWWILNRGECKQVLLSPPPQYPAEIYVHGESGNGTWESKDFSFCVVKDKFEFTGLSATSCLEKARSVNANKFIVRPGVNNYNFKD